MITGSGTFLNLVDNNYIGLDATGLIGLGNGIYGVQIQGAGTNNVRGNLITGNTGGGVVIGGIGVATVNQQIDSNGIGITEAGIAIGQGGAGVSITGFVRALRRLEHRGRGTRMQGSSSSATHRLGSGGFRFNNIKQNAGLGIDLDGGEPRAA